MARKGQTAIHGVIPSVRQVNRTESGVIHCADSLAGGREGTFVEYLGAPGSMLEKSPSVSSGFAGRTPNVANKFMGRTQK